MVRIIAPVCPGCGKQTGVTEVYATFDKESKLDPIDLNLAKWMVRFGCQCGYMTVNRINDVKVPLWNRGPVV